MAQLEQPPYIPVTPWTPPAPDPSPPQSGYFPVGYSGTNGGVGTQTGGYGGQPQFPWGGFNQANQQSQQAAESGLNQLLQFGSQSPYGQGLMNMFNSPYGLPPELLAQQRRMLAETEAGSRENALRRSKQAANASGFGNSLGAIRAQDMIRTESAANLNNAQARLAIDDALLGMQRQMGAGGLYNSLYGTDAGLRQSYAQGQLGRQFPIVPGGTGGGGSPYGNPSQSPGWSQSGKYMPQGTGYDPFVQGAGNAGPGGGWSPQQPRPSW